MLGGAFLWLVSKDFDLNGDGSEDAAAKAPFVPKPTTDRFDEGRAFALLRRQVEVYGWRPAGSKALRALAEDLRRRMPRGRFEPLGRDHPGLRNVVGTVPGTKPAIVIGAHYDVEARPKGFVGANDGAAGTAAVVELARAFARLDRPAGAPELRFV
ncbi:MAG TPA: M28 family peptidase, partial [Solirubrobacteraceae bacterium]|nr:M28 family peptidase [Solirubrobacteraceae bacterium]